METFCPVCGEKLLEDVIGEQSEYWEVRDVCLNCNYVSEPYLVRKTENEDD